MVYVDTYPFRNGRLNFPQLLVWTEFGDLLLKKEIIQSVKR